MRKLALATLVATFVLILVGGVVRVSDSGLGIRRQTMPRIFEPFFTTKERGQGAGLGLAFARELAERMNGELSVHSVPGATTFSLTLPVS